MSAKAIYEFKAKELIHANIHGCANFLKDSPHAVVTAETNWDELKSKNSWLQTTEKLVAKPDQLIKRRGKLGLISIGNVTNAQEWIEKTRSTEFEIGNTKGYLRHFLLEPFLPHAQEEECYACIYSTRDEDVILFYHAGGMDVGDVDSKARRLSIPIEGSCNASDVESSLMQEIIEPSRKKTLTTFLVALYDVYRRLHFTYLELNPIVVASDGKIHILDAAAKLDQCAEYLCKSIWGDLEFPPPFGRDLLPEEAYIADLDAKSGASLKLTILNANGRIWTMVAGGGASVVYTDTICELGGASELANYGEYSGAPTEQQTYEYAKVLLSLMTRTPPREDGKVLLIGGGIANFTNVAATFKGIVKALRNFQRELQEHKVTIFVRRAGPNYQEGLRIMRELGETLGIPIHVFGPETHMTAIVGMALGSSNVPQQPPPSSTTANFLLPISSSKSIAPDVRQESELKDKAAWSSPLPSKKETIKLSQEAGDSSTSRPLFHSETRAIVWGMQNRAVQSMLDFDYACSRSSPSVVAMVYPFVGNHKQKFYWGHKEILIPLYKDLNECVRRHPEADVMINFASLRSAYESSCEVIDRWSHQIRCIAIIAEGIPENLTRIINKKAHEKNVVIIGPATVGAIKPGCFKVGNTGGMMDNILQSKLFFPGSVAYVSRSGGMSNELNNIISLNADSVYEGVAIGGDRYPGSTFLDHVLRFQDDENVKLIVLLGEVGGTEEYRIVESIRNGRITKPMVAWCIGTCARLLSSEVQFGHAGSCAQAEQETATAKNEALREVGVYVPQSFDQLGVTIQKVYEELLAKGEIIPREAPPPPTVPMDFAWARELGLIRKPASVMTSICDERGQELLYAGIPISEIINQDFGIGGVLSLLWFQKRLPSYACKFLEICLIVTADHGPAVSGAHNTIVCARAGRDVVSCLTSGLLTIGERFGGALDGAAKQFSQAFDSGQIPMEFVNEMRKKGELIMGIGHRVKSINNPDKRVEILKNYIMTHFPAYPLLKFALEVEKITTSKKPNLILNVDGIIGVGMVDLLRHCGAFTLEEATENVENGVLNALFVLGRSIGFIGHFLDQRRLKQGLYRHPWDDISYILPEGNAE
jgi:ATP citrate (pro-S)-lyase